MGWKQAKVDEKWHDRSPFSMSKIWIWWKKFLSKYSTMY
jgi:hypothetical protein